MEVNYKQVNQTLDSILLRCEYVHLSISWIHFNSACCISHYFIIQSAQPLKSTATKTSLNVDTNNVTNTCHDIKASMKHLLQHQNQPSLTHHINKSAQSFTNLKHDNVAQVTKISTEMVSSASAHHLPTWTGQGTCRFGDLRVLHLKASAL